MDETVAGALGALAETPPHNPELFFDLLSIVYEDMERTGDGAEYEPFGAHSHYGLIVGEQSHQQVADAIRGFLEAHRL